MLGVAWFHFVIVDFVDPAFFLPLPLAVVAKSSSKAGGPAFVAGSSPKTIPPHDLVAAAPIAGFALVAVPPASFALVAVSPASFALVAVPSPDTVTAVIAISPSRAMSTIVA